MHICVTLALCTLCHPMVCHPVVCVKLCMSLGERAEPATEVVSRGTRPGVSESLRTRLRRKGNGIDVRCMCGGGGLGREGPLAKVNPE